jgi:hypothetical protein
VGRDLGENLRRGGGCCEHFEAILYGAYYIILLPKPHGNTSAHLFFHVSASRLHGRDTHTHTQLLLLYKNTNTYVRTHVLHALRSGGADCQVGPRFLRVPQGSQTVGMIEQGRLDSVLRFCNTCILLLSPSGLDFPPDALVMPHHPRRDAPLAHHPGVLMFMFLSSSCSRTDVAGRERVDQPRNGYRTRNAAVLPAAGCIDQGRAGASEVGPPPIKCSVWRWAKCI